MLKVFPYLEDIFGLYGTFWGLASILFLLLPIVFICVPEAKDVGLEDVSGGAFINKLQSTDFDGGSQAAASNTELSCQMAAAAILN